MPKSWRNNEEAVSEIEAPFSSDSRAPPRYQRKYAEQVAQAAQHGATRTEIMTLLGIDANVLLLWSMTHADFAEALRANDDRRTRRVEDTLYQRACGYTYPSEKIMVIDGQVVRVEITEIIPPDVAAARAWLEQKDAENWRPKRELNVTAQVAAITDATSQPEALALCRAVFDGAVIDSSVEEEPS